MVAEVGGRASSVEHHLLRVQALAVGHALEEDPPPYADDEPDVVLLGVGGGDEEDPVEPPEDDKRGDVSTLISEFLVLAFPLLYTPGGTGRFLRLGSSSMVGKFCKSVYVK